MESHLLRSNGFGIPYARIRRSVVFTGPASGFRPVETLPGAWVISFHEALMGSRRSMLPTQSRQPGRLSSSLARRRAVAVFGGSFAGQEEISTVGDSIQDSARPEIPPSSLLPEPEAVTTATAEGLGDGTGLAPHYVVGIGASAGGLEAIERFFDHVPLSCGLSFVLVQHLSPDFKSLMDELLARHTKITIHRVQHGMPIERDAIYLIPPKTNMKLSDGRLWLSDQEPKSGPNLPIDIFLRSLAQAAGSRAIGVILSGTGSDGSRGIREIHEKGGLVVVQDPETAGFDGMPKAAIGTGVVDLVLAPEAMPGRILQYMGHPAGLGASDQDLVVSDDLTVLFSLLRRRYAIDFTLYKPGTIARRLERRMSLSAMGSLAEYVKHLEGSPDEIEALLPRPARRGDPVLQGPVRVRDHPERSRAPALRAGIAGRWHPGLGSRLCDRRRSLFTCDPVARSPGVQRPSRRYQGLRDRCAPGFSRHRRQRNLR